MSERHTVFDYLEWRGDLSLHRAPFNEVDNLILAMASFLNYEGIVPEDFRHSVPFPEAVDKFLARPEKERWFGLLIPDITADLIAAAAESPRFRKASLCGFRNMIDTATETQFCAVTLLLPDNTFFVSIRGTDDTLVGWKENLNLAWQSVVPAESAAVSYVTEAAAALPHRFRIGGHSKGGHLSLYAAMYIPAPLQKRLIRAYSNDGPGFCHDEFSSENYARVKDKVFTYIPKSSIVGEIFYHDDNYKIIESSGTGIMQHDPFTWDVLGTGFVYLGERSPFGKMSAEGLRAWIAEMSEDDRVFAVATIGELFSAAGDKTLTEVGRDFWRFAGEAHKKFRGLDKESRSRFITLMMDFLRKYRIAKAENINLILQNPLKLLDFKPEDIPNLLGFPEENKKN